MKVKASVTIDVWVLKHSALAKLCLEREFDGTKDVKAMEPRRPKKTFGEGCYEVKNTRCLRNFRNILTVSSKKNGKGLFIIVGI